MTTLVTKLAAGVRLVTSRAAGVRQHCCAAAASKQDLYQGDGLPPYTPISLDDKYPTIPGTSMRSLVKQKPERGLWMQSSEIPQIGPTDVLVNISKTSICGTDIHIYNWDEWSQATVPTPMTIGHEWVGVIEEVGPAVTRGLKKGDRVSGEGHVTCGFCRNCRAGKRHLCRNTVAVGVNRPGAFAEYVSIPASNAFPISDSITDDFAAIMDPLGNAIHCVTSYDLIGEDVLITGAGPIGAMAAAACKQVGARFVAITDINDYRLDLAKQCGADLTINVDGVDPDETLKDAMQHLGMTEGFDVGFEMSGYAAGLSAMLPALNNGAKIALLGIPPAPFSINWHEVVFKGLEIRGIYGREMFETWYKMKNLLEGGLQKRIEPIMTHKFAAADHEEAFELVAGGLSGKIVLDW